jgi:DNA mismatch repair protein MutL
VVSDLFYNTPARLKYMKSLHTELSNITDFFNRLALSHPDVAMKLSHNGRTLIKTTGNGDIRQVMRAIYGLETARKMIPVEGESLDFRLTGYISLPEVTRASRNYLLTSVNGRFIRNYTLNQAILAGYHTLLPIGRFPICYLHIEMDPILVDVNVHPSKLEVRFSKEKELAEWITSRIRESFRRLTLIPEPKPKPFFPEKPAQLNFSPGADLRGTVQERKTLTSSERKIALTLWKDGDISITREARVPESLTESEFQMTEEEREGYVPDSVSAGDEGSGRTADNGESRVPPLRPIGQMHGTYILAENENGLYIIDQHAAQERIKFEFYRKKLGEVPRDLQDLLFPLTLELSNEEYVKLSEYLGELQAVGVFLEPFGQQTYIVRSHPQWFPKGEEEETIREIIDQVLEMKKVDLEQLRERTAMMMSCKGSIKANQYLRKEEIEQLLNDLRRTANPFTCPHGRPVIIHFSNYELEKMFKRVM